MNRWHRKRSRGHFCLALSDINEGGITSQWKNRKLFLLSLFKQGVHLQTTVAAPQEIYFLESKQWETSCKKCRDTGVPCITSYLSRRMSAGLLVKCKERRRQRTDGEDEQDSVLNTSLTPPIPLTPSSSVPPSTCCSSPPCHPPPPPPPPSLFTHQTPAVRSMDTWRIHPLPPLLLQTEMTTTASK